MGRLEPFVSSPPAGWTPRHSYHVRTLCGKPSLTVVVTPPPELLGCDTKWSQSNNMDQYGVRRFVGCLFGVIFSASFPYNISISSLLGKGQRKNHLAFSSAAYHTRLYHLTNNRHRPVLPQLRKDCRDSCGISRSVKLMPADFQSSAARLLVQAT